MVYSSTSRRQCEFRFHGRLERFLPPARRGCAFVHAFDGTPAVKDPIEALGVPHPEAGDVRIDGVSAALTRHLLGGERIDVLPALRSCLPAPPEFVLDVHLGRLAGYLRLLGIDCIYRNDTGDDELFDIARTQGRALLSRDIGLLKRAGVQVAAFVYATDPLIQLVEVVERFALEPCLRPFTRCVHCNGGVEPIDPDLATDIPPKVRLRGGPFSRCTGCHQLYWRGTHEARLRERLALSGLYI